MLAEDAPQVVDNGLPEVQHAQFAPEPVCPDYAAQSKREVHAYYNEVVDAKETGQERRTILGMQRRNFWILTLIALMIVGVIVGGSVGGVLAVQNSRSKTEPASAPSATAPSSMIPTPSPFSTPTSSVSPSASSPLYIPPLASSVLDIDISCPPILQSYNGKGYRCFQNTDINSLGDITGISAYSLQQCIDACSTMNDVEGLVKCQAVALSQALSDEYGHNKGANCWLKNVTNPRAGRAKLTVAVLNV